MECKGPREGIVITEMFGRGAFGNICFPVRMSLFLISRTASSGTTAASTRRRPSARSLRLSLSMPRVRLLTLWRVLRVGGREIAPVATALDARRAGRSSLMRCWVRSRISPSPLRTTQTPVHPLPKPREWARGASCASAFVVRTSLMSG